MNHELPREPAARILRPASAAAWHDADALRAEARKLRDAAEEAATAMRHEGHTQGYAEGLHEGHRQCVRLMAEMREQLDAYLDDIEPKLVSLVTDLMRRLLGRFDPVDLIAHFVFEHLRSLRTAEPLTLWVAPSHASRLAELLPTQQLTIRGDASLSDGRALLVGFATSVEVHGEHQLERVLQTLAATLSSMAPRVRHDG